MESNDNTITINAGGTYYITGSISDASIVIDASKDEDVQLVLDNCSITSLKSSVINGIKCNKLTITLADNSENTLTDNSNYTVFTDTEDSEPNGTLFTKSDLVINGNGKLIINANYEDGIVSKDGLKIINANIEVISADDGIRGKDYVAINNATLNIKSTGDGIKSTNSSDQELGYIAIEGGNITINSKEDGIQAETIIKISSAPELNITTTGNVTSSSNSNFGKGNFNSNSTDNDVSSKGIKAGTKIEIEDGTYNITSTDDSVHSNGVIVINNGKFNLSSGDDGIHADTSITINDGEINITKSYEGIESSYIEINSGKISLVSSDDGINVSDGSSSSMQNGRMDFNENKNSNLKLVINGGEIEVNVNGDGLDSNGSIYINGGTTIVCGPTSNGDAPLDYDGEFIIKGGTLIAYGSAGMWQNPSSSSTQYSVVFQTSGKSGDNIVLKDTSGNELISVNAQKDYSVVIISDTNIKSGEEYTLYVNNSNIESITVNDIISTNSNLTNSNGMQPGGMKPNANMEGNNEFKNDNEMRPDGNGDFNSEMQQNGMTPPNEGERRNRN